MGYGPDPCNPKMNNVWMDGWNWKGKQGLGVVCCWELNEQLKPEMMNDITSVRSSIYLYLRSQFSFDSSI